MKINIGNVQLKKKIYIGNVRIGVKKIYPELEDLTVTPTATEQNFKSTKYGYNNVKVKAVEGEELNIIPSTEKQEYKGVYNKVNVSAIESEEITIIPSAAEQVKEGMYKKVTVAGDSNLVADNIKEGTSIFGVEGSAKTTNLKITDATSLFFSNARLDQMEDILKLLGKVKTCYQMFQSSSNLTDLDLSDLDSSELENIDWMFASCSNMKNLTIFDMGKVNVMGYCFHNMKNLETINNVSNIGKGFTRKSNNNSSYNVKLSDSTKLTYETLINFITNGLYDLNLTYDVANGGTLYTQKLMLGTNNIAKLNADEINIAVQKGFSVS